MVGVLLLRSRREMPVPVVAQVAHRLGLALALALLLRALLAELQELLVLRRAAAAVVNIAQPCSERLGEGRAKLAPVPLGRQLVGWRGMVREYWDSYMGPELESRINGQYKVFT